MRTVTFRFRNSNNTSLSCATISVSLWSRLQLTPGAEDEARNADRIAQQQEELDRLTKQRDALLNK